MVSSQLPEVPRTNGVWLRWSWRDLRHHWVAVVVIALVMAIGIGVYAGLGSTSTWRRLSNDESFAVLDMHDLQVTLSPGTFIEEGTLSAAVDGLEDSGAVVAASERIVVDNQIDASTESDSISGRGAHRRDGRCQWNCRRRPVGPRRAGACRWIVFGSAGGEVRRTLESAGSRIGHRRREPHS